MIRHNESPQTPAASPFSSDRVRQQATCIQDARTNATGFVQLYQGKSRVGSETRTVTCHPTFSIHFNAAAPDTQDKTVLRDRTPQASQSEATAENTPVHLDRRETTLGREWGLLTLRQACCRENPDSAMCVQNFNGSRGFAIRITYRISLRSSSLREPRHPLLKVVCTESKYIRVTASTPIPRSSPFPETQHRRAALPTSIEEAGLHCGFSRSGPVHSKKVVCLCVGEGYQGGPLLTPRCTGEPLQYPLPFHPTLQRLFSPTRAVKSLPTCWSAKSQPNIRQGPSYASSIHVKEQSSISDRCGNDPSAGSPTETLLRLHLPLNDKV